MAHKRNSVEVPELEKLLAGKKKKYVRYEEGAVLYSMGKNSFRQVAQDAHAVVRLKRIALVNVEVLDEYLESFREWMYTQKQPKRKRKNPWPLCKAHCLSGKA